MTIPKIMLEEHVALPDTVKTVPDRFTPSVWKHFSNALVDIHGQLLSDMDANGIELAVLSINTPGIQGIPNRKKAVEEARRSNDYLAEQVARNPRRFQAWAALPLQDPGAAAEELERCVTQLGFRGALVNSFTQLENEPSPLYYDHPQFWDFWAALERLDVPLYLHPRDPFPERTTFLEGHPWLHGAAWSFTLDAVTHALRLMGSGLFDKYPKLTIIMGHLGESLPFLMWRIDDAMRWTPRGCPAKKKFNEYFKNNFYVTTSGQFCTQSLLDTLLWLGADRILFSTDYPFQQISDAVAWFDSLNAIGDADLLKIARNNAERLLKLGRPSKVAAPA